MSARQTVTEIRLGSQRINRLALAAGCLLLTACGSSTKTTGSTTTVTVTQAWDAASGSKTVIDPYGFYDNVIDKNGIYIIGADIFPGRYRTAGNPECYWARLRSGDARDIIDSHKNSGPQVIEIRESDTAFLTQNCGMWQLVPNP